MPHTIRVRIAVAVDPGGEWNANGWGGLDTPCDADAMRMALEQVGPGAAEYWIETEVVVPEPAPGGAAPVGPR
jgi:hypothetical protein